MFRAVYCLACLGLFRVGKLVYTCAPLANRPLIVSDLIMENGLKELKVVLRQSKTDQLGKSVTITIPQLKDNKVCPVYNMHVFMKK